MPAFIFVSGYFAKYYMKKNVPDVSKLLGFLILFIIFKGLLWGLNSLLQGKIATFDIFSESGAPWYLLGMFAWYMFLPLFAKFKPWVSLTMAICAGLIVGFSNQIGPFFALSRIFVFFPFFLAGYFFPEGKEEALTKKRNKYVAVVFLLVLLLGIFFKVGTISTWQGLIYGNRPYVILNAVASESKVMMVRLFWYVLALTITFAIMALIPKKRNAISYIGSRTLSIYILHILIRQVFSHYNIYDLLPVGGVGLLVFCVIVSAIVLVLLSEKRTFLLFQRVFKIKYDMFMNME